MVSKKIIGVCLCLLALVLIFALVIFTPQSIYLLSSPSGRNTVEIYDENSFTSLLLFDRIIRFNYWRSGNLLVSDQYFAAFDGGPSEFLHQFPRGFWVNENTLRISRSSELNIQDYDQIVITNRTDKHLKYLRVDALDIFLIFDIQPEQKLELKIPYYKWQSWIAAEGMFDDGTKLKRNGVNFFHQDKLNQPLRYCVSITDDELLIRSPLIEGWASNKPNIPRSETCEE